jgi:cobalamin biosynthesis protein CobD/CbiB
MLNSLLLIPFVLLLDRLLGEPRHFHPLVGFGVLANKIEATLNHNKHRFHKGWLACHWLEKLKRTWLSSNECFK